MKREKKKKLASGWKVSQKKDMQKGECNTAPAAALQCQTPGGAKQLQAKPSSEPGFDEASVGDFFFLNSFQNLSSRL